MRADAVEWQEGLRREADALLEQRGLRGCLARYGRVHVVGSYALGLMVWRDLDIYLETVTSVRICVGGALLLTESSCLGRDMGQWDTGSTSWFS